MIRNGKNSRVGAAAQFVPDVSAAVMDLMQHVSVSVMQKVYNNGYVSEIPVTTKTMGVKQPFTARQLEIKPEGQRGWQWYRIHMLADVTLKLDDRFIMDGVKYRVMRSSNYPEYGYNEYDAIEDYQR